MFIRFSRWLVVLVLSLSIGLHWEVLQSVAWFGMVINYSQGTSLIEGLSKTFDGKHPCKLCKMITEGKQTEKKPEAQFTTPKIDLLLATQKPVVFSPSFTLLDYPLSSSWSTRVDPPLTPPPRSV